jgi:hypothetical protein
MVKEEPGRGIEPLPGRYPNRCQKSYPEMLSSKFSCFLLNILNARPVSSFDLLVVAAISHPHHCDFKSKARRSFHIPFKSDGPRKLCISFRGGKGYGPD